MSGKYARHPLEKQFDDWSFGELLKRLVKSLEERKRGPTGDEALEEAEDV